MCVDNNSGLAGIAYWINNFYELPEEMKISKSDELVLAIKSKIDEMFANGRCSAMSDDELNKLVAQNNAAKYRAFVANVNK